MRDWAKSGAPPRASASTTSRSGFAEGAAREWGHGPGRGATRERGEPGGAARSKAAPRETARHFGGLRLGEVACSGGRAAEARWLVRLQRGAPRRAEFARDDQRLVPRIRHSRSGVRRIGAQARLRPRAPTTPSRGPPGLRHPSAARAGVSTGAVRARAWCSRFFGQPAIGPLRWRRAAGGPQRLGDHQGPPSAKRLRNAQRLPTPSPEPRGCTTRAVRELSVPSHRFYPVQSHVGLPVELAKRHRDLCPGAGPHTS